MPVYKISPLENGEGGTTVVANPTLEGTEPDLTGLEVEGTKYKVPSGGGGTQHLYQHNITIKGEEEGDYNFSIVILSSSNQPITYGDVLNYLLDNNFIITHHYDPETQEDTYAGNSYSLGVSGGLGGGTSYGCDNAFALNASEEGEDPNYIICFVYRDNYGIQDYMVTSNEATVNDIVLQIL